jgi:hypothetical protein
MAGPGEIDVVLRRNGRRIEMGVVRADDGEPEAPGFAFDLFELAMRNLEPVLSSVIQAVPARGDFEHHVVDVAPMVDDLPTDEQAAALIGQFLDCMLLDDLKLATW